MNKSEYLSNLKEALKDTDESTMEEIVSDYEEHFQVGMEYGKSEEQICEELGSIEDLVEEIKEVYHTSDTEEKKSESDKTNKNNKGKEWYSAIYNLDGEKIGEAINSALDTAGDAISKIDVNEISRTVKNTLDQATTSINNFASNHFKNQWKDTFDSRKKDNGFNENVSRSFDDSVDFTETPVNNVSFETDTDGETITAVTNETEKTDNSTDETEAAENVETTEQTETVNESKDSDSHDAATGLNLIIDGIHADIEVRKSPNSKINIKYENNGDDRQRQMFEFYSYKEGNTVYAGIRRVGKAVFLFNFKLYSTTIYVEVPDNMNNLSIKTASGNIELSDVLADHILATTASGDIEADNIEAKFLSLKSASGDIDTRNITAEVIDNGSSSGDLDAVNTKAGECKISTTSGDIDVNNTTLNNLDISSVSGDIKISRLSGKGLRASSTSGDISLDVNVRKCYLMSKSGDVSANCIGDVILESNSTSGDTKVKLGNNNNGYSLKARTVSGDLYIDYDKSHQRDLKSGTYTHGNQGSELTLSSISGDIHLYD